MSSAAGCSSLIREILPPCVHACVDPHIDLALTAWKQSHSESPPSLPESSYQRVWGAPLIAVTVTSLLDGASQQATAHLLAAAILESGTWLNNALPISSLGLKADDDVVRIATGLCLGVAICHPHKCRSCGADVDSLGTHGLSCFYSSGCHCRHAAVNDIVKRSLDSARIPSRPEPIMLTTFPIMLISYSRVCVALFLHSHPIIQLVLHHVHDTAWLAFTWKNHEIFQTCNTRTAKNL